VEAGHRAALALPGVGVVGRVGQLGEAAGHLVVLELGARLHGHVAALLLLLVGVEVLRDVEHLRVVAGHQVAGGGQGRLAEGDEMHVGVLDVLVPLEAQGLHRHAPTAHHERVAVLVGGVGRDDEQQAVQRQQLVGLLAADPALVRRGEVGQEQGEDGHVEELGGQRVDGVAELAEEGLDRVARQLERLLELEVEEVTLVHALKR